MSDFLMANAVPWQSFPLCCRYRLVCMEEFPIQTVADGVASNRMLHWALGVLAGGEYEVLGAWPEPLASGAGWQEVFEDIKVRGVTKIQFVSSRESNSLLAALHAVYPTATLLPSALELGTVPAVPARIRTSIRVSAKAMQFLRRRATMAVSRHGLFPDIGEAVAFVLAALERAEQGIGMTAARAKSTSRHVIDAGTRSVTSKAAASDR